MSDIPARLLSSVPLAWAAVPLMLALGFGLCPPAVAADLTLEAAVHNPQRSAKFLARDDARHPLEELAFFGVTPHSTVVEIWPGGGYSTEILAPFLKATASIMLRFQAGA